MKKDKTEERILKSCRKCGIELEKEKYYPSRIKKCDWVCPQCCRDDNKQYAWDRKFKELVQLIEERRNG